MQPKSLLYGTYKAIEGGHYYQCDCPPERKGMMTPVNTSRVSLCTKHQPGMC